MLNKELTPRQAARILGVSITTIHNMIQNGRIVNTRKLRGKFVRIPVDQIPGVEIAALQNAYEKIDRILGDAVHDGHLSVIKKLRSALKLLEEYQENPLSIKLQDVLRQTTGAAMIRPSVYSGPLLKVVNDLTAVFPCN